MIGIPYRKYFWLGEGCKMGNYEIIKEFLGEVITEEDLKSTDFYIHPKIALMIPNLEVCKYIKNPLLDDKQRINIVKLIFTSHRGLCNYIL